MTTYAFLSPDWVDQARAIRASHAADEPTPPIPVALNVVVTDAPADVAESGEVHGHIDTSSGSTVLEYGHLDTVDLTVTTDYVTARGLFLDQDPAVVMQAFMGGKILVEGDVMKLMALQGGGPTGADTALAEQVYAELREITTPLEPTD